MRRLSLFCAVLFFVTASTPIAATTPTPRPLQERTTQIREANQEYRETIKNARQEFKASVSGERDVLRKEIRDAREDRREEVEEARQEFRSDKAGQHADRLERRFRWYEERLTTIATRIQTRITKEKTAGKDVLRAQSLLDTGKATLATAVSDGKKAVSMFKTIPVTTYDVQKPEVKAAIDQAQQTRKGFVDARKSMLDAVKAL